uniref:Protein kinase domain-containing protein n=1 Tax=Physcomitrium patens TaxID=3218 RepID=A0A2K1L747_PHYPA|nr:hypothetical protein PHYPA_000292 [Physcomitrium patens]
MSITPSFILFEIAQSLRKPRLLSGPIILRLSEIGARSGKLVLLNGVPSSLYEKWIRQGVGALVDKKRIVGEGSIGTVYQATTSDGTIFALKKFSTLELMRDAEEIEVNMRSLDHVRNPNLVKVQGFYLTTTLKLILSKFGLNGTLSDCVHNSNQAVNPSLGQQMCIWMRGWREN